MLGTRLSRAGDTRTCFRHTAQRRERTQSGGRRTLYDASVPRELIFTGPRQVSFREYEESPLGPGQVRVRTLLSGISHGTEMNIYRGTSPQYARGVRDGLFTDEAEPAYRYPMTYGYEEVGEVVEVGPEVAGILVGDRVTGSWQHRESAAIDVAHQRRFFVWPSDFAPERAVFIALATVALNDFLSSETRLGESAVIFGQGTIGSFVAQICHLAGVAPIIVVDPIAARRERALALGATHAIEPTGAAQRVREILGRNGADVVFENSGSYRALQEAIRCCAPIYGKVMAVSWYQGGGDDLRLGEEWHHSFTLRAGASRMLHNHLALPPAPGRQWDEPRLHRTAFDLIVSGRLATEGLVSHRIPFARAAEAFDLIDCGQEQTTKVVLDFRE